MKEKVIITAKLCDTLMDTLACLAYSVTGDMDISIDYAENRFVALLSEWEETNGFEFAIEEVGDEECI